MVKCTLGKVAVNSTFKISEHVICFPILICPLPALIASLEGGENVYFTGRNLKAQRVFAASSDHSITVKEELEFPLSSSQLLNVESLLLIDDQLSVKSRYYFFEEAKKA